MPPLSRHSKGLQASQKHGLWEIQKGAKPIDYSPVGTLQRWKHLQHHNDFTFLVSSFQILLRDSSMEGTEDGAQEMQKWA